MDHEGGKEWVSGAHGGGSTQIAWWKPGSEVGGGLRYRIRRELFRAKSQRFGADDGDACGCRDPLEGVVVATPDVLGLRVKTLDPCGLDEIGRASCRERVYVLV